MHTWSITVIKIILIVEKWLLILKLVIIICFKAAWSRPNPPTPPFNHEFDTTHTRSTCYYYVLLVCLPSFLSSNLCFTDLRQKFQNHIWLEMHLVSGEMHSSVEFLLKECILQQKDAFQLKEIHPSAEGLCDSPWHAL